MPSIASLAVLLLQAGKWMCGNLSMEMEVWKLKYGMADLHDDVTYEGLGKTSTVCHVWEFCSPPDNHAPL